MPRQPRLAPDLESCAVRTDCPPDEAAEDTDGGSEAEQHPCTRPADRRAYALCVWVEEDELARIVRDPDARIEVPATVSLAGEHFDDVELELHGGFARTRPKKSYRLRFASDRPTFDFFGDGREQLERVVLQASWVDPTFVRAKLVFDVLRELGALAPRVSHARLYINGELEGLYQVIERVDAHFLERHGLSRDGNLYKAESHSADFAHRDDPLAGFSERTHEDGRAKDLEDLFAAVDRTPASHADFEAEIATRIHLGDFSRWNQVMVHALNLDTFSKNYYLYHDPKATTRAGRLFRIIHWDADTTFGLWWTGERYDRPDEAPLYGARNILARRIYEIPEYRAAYVARFAELLDGPLSAAVLTQRAELLLSELESDIRADLSQWERDTSYDDERAYLLDVIGLREQVMTALLESERATQLTYTSGN